MGQPTARQNIESAKAGALKFLAGAKASHESSAIAAIAGGGVRAMQCALLELYAEGKVRRKRIGPCYFYRLPTPAEAATGGTQAELPERDRLRNALKVFLLDRRIRAFLDEHDPKSVEQAEAALGEKVPAPEPLETIAHSEACSTRTGGECDFNCAPGYPGA